MLLDVRELMHGSSFISFSCQVEWSVPVVVNRMHISLATIHKSDAHVRVASLRGQVQWPST